jgi:hypothetical protein
LDQFIKPARGLEEGIGQVEREARAISRLPGFQIIEEPTDVGEEQVADLGFLVERRLDLAERVFPDPSACRRRKARPGFV